MLGNRHYIRRCHELARLGDSRTSPNPKVGALILVNQRIVGEGWHEEHGQNHAEINALAAVTPTDKSTLLSSTMFVSLEPCTIHGKTPPCTDAILKARIPHIVISARDKTTGVDGVSEYILQKEGVKVAYGIDHQLGDFIARPRNTFVRARRPYIILKWAESKDGYIAKKNESTPISNAFTNRYVHQLRAQSDAILVGSNTALIDNPSLTTRLFPGPNPLRIILGGDLEDLESLNLLSDGLPTLVMSKSFHPSSQPEVDFEKIKDPTQSLEQLCSTLYGREVMTLLVEGGAQTLQSFIDKDLWDECRIIRSSTQLEDGIAAPMLSSRSAIQSFNILDDEVKIFSNPHTATS